MVEALDPTAVDSPTVRFDLAGTPGWTISGPWQFKLTLKDTMNTLS